MPAHVSKISESTVFQCIFVRSYELSVTYTRLQAGPLAAAMSLLVRRNLCNCKLAKVRPDDPLHLLARMGYGVLGGGCVTIAFAKIIQCFIIRSCGGLQRSGESSISE